MKPQLAQFGIKDYHHLRSRVLATKRVMLLRLLSMLVIHSSSNIYPRLRNKTCCPNCGVDDSVQAMVSMTASKRWSLTERERETQKRIITKLLLARYPRLNGLVFVTRRNGGE